MDLLFLSQVLSWFFFIESKSSRSEYVCPVTSVVWHEWRLKWKKRKKNSWMLNGRRDESVRRVAVESIWTTTRGGKSCWEKVFAFWWRDLKVHLTRIFIIFSLVRCFSPENQMMMNFQFSSILCVVCHVPCFVVSEGDGEHQTCLSDGTAASTRVDTKNTHNKFTWQRRAEQSSAWKIRIFCVHSGGSTWEFHLR